ncbi:MAG: dTDP-glucose 4,6-dehydratase [Desulfobacterium sp.]|nr:dTDP-glucose 4,6-dehydratase [Desulfobacterium sp.]
MDKPNVLVTGGLGFIGSWYFKLLVINGYCPVVIDKYTYAADINRIKGNDYEDEIYIGDRLYISDICDRELVESIIQKHDINIIVNFAAETHVDRAIADSLKFIHSNIRGVHVLLELARKNDLKLVQISTDEVYGSITKESFEENDRLNPGNPYSATKASAELLTLSYHKTYGLPIVITRSSNNYGPGQFPEKFIPKMIQDAKQGKTLSVYGNGENIRDWLYVKDNCDAIMRVMEHGTSGEIYNIGGCNEMTNNQVAQIISKKLNSPIVYVPDRPGHDLRYSIDCSKIQREMNWKPVTTFEKGIDETIQAAIS